MKTGLSIVSNDTSATEVNLTAVMNIVVEAAWNRPARAGIFHSRPRGRARSKRPASATAAKVTTTPIQDLQNEKTGPVVEDACTKTGAVLKATTDVPIRMRGLREPRFRSSLMAAGGFNKLLVRALLGG